jgi:predicted dehydrogenase
MELNMSEKLRGVIIGAGFAAGFHLAGWSNTPQVEIEAVCDLRQDRAEAKAAQFNIPKVYTSFREMFDQHKVDFVDIAVPPESHLEIIRDAAARGYHVLCQKPIAPTLAELQEMIKAKELIDAGVIGEPYYTYLAYRRRMSLPKVDFGEQNFFKKMPRLVIYELGVHYLDTLRYLYGEAQSVYALTHRASPELTGEEVATVLAKFGNVNAVMDMSWASLPASTVKEWISYGPCVIEGTRGTLHLEQNGLFRIITDDCEEQIQYPPNSEFLAYQGAIQHFADCLRTGKDFETTGPDTLKTMELVFGAYDAAENNRVYLVGKDTNRLA